MRPEDVPAELVEKAARALSMERHGVPDAYSDWTRNEARIALAAVLLEVQVQVLEGIRSRVDHSFDHAYDEDIDPRHPEAGHAEGYRHRDRQVRTVLGLYATRLTATTEEPTK